MKLKVIGSHLCPGTLYALNKLVEAKIEMDFVNLSSSLPALKEYLNVRENCDLYNEVRAKDRVGIPCFVIGNDITLDLDEVLQRFSG